MNDIETFDEWVKRKSAKISKKSEPAPIKNKTIDAFLKSVDNLKRDMDKLDDIEKKEKPKSTEKKSDDKKADASSDIDSFKKYKDKRDSEEETEGKDAPNIKGKKDKEFDDDNDLPAVVGADRSDKRVRLLPNRKVPERIVRKRKEPNSQNDPRG